MMITILRDNNYGIYDIHDIVKISVVINSIDYKTNLSKNDFLLEDLIEEKTENSNSDEKSISEHKECENKRCEDNNCEKDTCEDNTSSNIIDEITNVRKFAVNAIKRTEITGESKVMLEKEQILLNVVIGKQNMTDWVFHPHILLALASYAN